MTGTRRKKQVGKMIDLIIENEQDKEEWTEELQQTVEDVCNAVLDSEECDFDAQISLTLVDNEEIREINNEQRGIDRATDVLSFPMLEFDENGDCLDADYETDGDFIVLGDIVISMERAREQSKEFGHSFRREIAFLTAHSMLHLLGYDHVDDPEGERIMFAKQDAVLNGLGITREQEN